MKSLRISGLRNHCVRILDEVHGSQEPLIVTRQGVPLVRIVPIAAPSAARLLGTLREVTTIKGDLVNTDFAEDWEMES